MAIRSISLFAGAGGLDLAMALVIPDLAPLLYVENEATAAQILASRITEGILPPAHIWSDITKLDGRKFRGAVDLIYGGFPCVDLSLAGKRAGITHGKKSGLWREYAKIIRQVRPSWVFIENVPGLLSAANGGVVLGQLAEMGFDAEWGVVSAKGVGAGHIRKRVFVLAYRRDGGLGNPTKPRREEPGPAQFRELSKESREGVHHRSEQPVGSMGHPLRPRLEIRGCERGDNGEEREAIERAGGSLDHSAIPRLNPRESQSSGKVWDQARGQEPDRRRDDLAIFAPGPNSPHWHDLLVRSPWLRPALAQTEAKSIVRGVVDGGANQLHFDNRTDRLRALGNMVCPMQGAAAFVELWERAVKGMNRRIKP